MKEKTKVEQRMKILRKVQKTTKRNNINSISSDNSTKLLAQWSKI